MVNGKNELVNKRLSFRAAINLMRLKIYYSRLTIYYYFDEIFCHLPFVFRLMPFAVVSSGSRADFSFKPSGFDQ